MSLRKNIKMPPNCVDCTRPKCIFPCLLLYVPFQFSHSHVGVTSPVLLEVPHVCKHFHQHINEYDMN